MAEGSNVTTQQQGIAPYNLDGLCLLRGTDWVFK
jgi:hypothetical protein